MAIFEKEKLIESTEIVEEEPAVVFDLHLKVVMGSKDTHETVLLAMQKRLDQLMSGIMRTHADRIAGLQEEVEHWIQNDMFTDA